MIQSTAKTEIDSARTTKCGGGQDLSFLGDWLIFNPPNHISVIEKAGEQMMLTL